MLAGTVTALRGPFEQQPRSEWLSTQELGANSPTIRRRHADKARLQTSRIALLADDQPVAIMHDFVNPLSRNRRL
jgi:hypothetical protein